VTRRKPLSESKRPRRHASADIRAFFGCPFCKASDFTGESDVLRVVAYRRKTVRVECSECGGRFSFDAFQVSDAMAKMPLHDDGHVQFPAFIARQIAGAVYVGMLRDDGETPEAIRAEMARFRIDEGVDEEVADSAESE